MTRNGAYSEIAEELQLGKCTLQQATGESIEGMDRLYLWARNARRGKCSQNPSSKFIGLRMGRDSWQMFICRQGWLEAGWSKMAQWDSLFQFHVVAHHSSDKACPQQLCQGPKREDRSVQSVSQLQLKSCMKSCSLYAVPQSKSPAHQL